ncbi:hypothetical protein BUY35_00260 [Staphylococcus cohnii]|nr:hypothetical protein BUY35_00260 [Staphylococcus cohnii]
MQSKYDKFSKQFVSGRRIRKKCNECGYTTSKIVSKSCQDNENYKICNVSVKCDACEARDDFFINKDYYGYIDARAKPLNGDWTL